MDVFALTPESRAYFRAAAVSAALELGVFEALDAPRELDGLARALGVAPRRLRALCDVLVMEGLLRREGSRVSRARVEPATGPVVGAFGRLAEVIRRDRPEVDPGDAEFQRRLHQHLAEAGAAPAGEFGARLAPMVGDGSFVDAGGGAGAYTAALLEAAPRSTAVLVDMAPVVELARERLRSARVRFVAGDLRETDLGAGHRAALCVNLLHLHPRAVCERILARLRASLAPGGWLAVKDFDVAPDRSGPPEALYFALSMIVFTEGGDVHAPADIAAWMQAAGLEVPARVDLASAPESFVLLARAPPR